MSEFDMKLFEEHNERRIRQSQACDKTHENKRCYKESPKADPPGVIREDHFIAFKVQDACRTKKCLTVRELGPARHAEMRDPDANNLIIIPPHDAVTVEARHFRIKHENIISKTPLPFRSGYWKVTVEYVFEYKLIFKNEAGRTIEKVRAESVFTDEYVLYGAVGKDLTVTSDFPLGARDDATLEEPFVMVEAKAILLEAVLSHKKRRDVEIAPTEVHVTIGLFAIIKLFRLATLRVPHLGEFIPPECSSSTPVDVCEYFRQIDFPKEMINPAAGMRQKIEN